MATVDTGLTLAQRLAAGLRRLADLIELPPAVANYSSRPVDCTDLTVLGRHGCV
jgi:hypothetical protein